MAIQKLTFPNYYDVFNDGQQNKAAAQEAILQLHNIHKYLILGYNGIGISGLSGKTPVIKAGSMWEYGGLLYYTDSDIVFTFEWEYWTLFFAPGTGFVMADRFSLASSPFDCARKGYYDHNSRALVRRGSILTWRQDVWYNPD